MCYHVFFVVQSNFIDIYLYIYIYFYRISVSGNHMISYHDIVFCGSVRPQTVIACGLVLLTTNSKAL